MLTFFLFILGLCFGSFFNVLADRLSNEQSINGRSHCDKCKKMLQWFDLIPVFSFIFVKGKCRYCKSKLSFYYPLSELLTGVSFVLSWYFAPVSFLMNPWQIIGMKVVAIGIISCLLVILLADVKYQIIPDPIQIALLIFSILWIVIPGISLSVFFHHIGAGLVVMLPILLIFLFTQGRGMGFGDVKLAFTIGFLLEMIGGFIALYIAFVSGAVVGVILMVTQRKKMKSKIAFGPFLVLGITIIFFIGPQLIETVRRMYFW